MQVFIGAISSDERLMDLLKIQQAFIPREVRSSEAFSSLRMTFAFGFFDPEKDERSLEDYLLYITREADAVFLIADEKFRPLFEKIRVAPFVCYFRPIAPEEQLDNALIRVASRGIQNFFWMLRKMVESSNEQPLKLPIRNFAAEELTNIANVCAHRANEPDFPRTIEGYLAKLKRRKQPRRDDSRRQRYYHDDHEKLFSQGKEQHARLPTGAPHSQSCVLNGNFRFGKRIETLRHFNVTKVVKGESKISGTFPNCHDIQEVVKETTHLNMFANDFF